MRNRRGGGSSARRVAALFVAALAGCGGDATGPDGGVTLEFDLGDPSHGWVAGFADYEAGRDEDLELTAEQRALPAGVGAGSGFFLSGRNLSDDLFMFVKRRVTGLRPSTPYRVSLAVEFVSNAPTGCIGIGGAPGEAVTVKAGATAQEPEAVETAEGELRMNVDKGEQSNGGEDAVVLGHVGIDSDECTDTPWMTKALETESALTATTGADGTLWLLVGTDSGFEGTTSLYYTRVVAELEVAS